jgi:hypothetical protein
MGQHSSASGDSGKAEPLERYFETPHMRLPAWAGSAGLHAALFVGITLWWYAMPPKGVHGEPERGTGIALVDMRQARPAYHFAPAESIAEAAAATAARPASPLPTVSEDLAEGVPALPAVADGNSGVPAAAGLPQAGSFTSSGRPSRVVGGQVTTGVFGVSGTGSRFVYVFDRSSSMEGFGGRPLAAAKLQLLESLQHLSDTHQFQIVFYNEQPLVFNPNAPQPARLLFADDQSKRLAENYVQGITGVGGTEHFAAIQLALQMRPDVIFFLTDGTADPITPRQLEQIERTNQRIGASINAIEFGAGAQVSYNFLSRLAKQNGGQYVYVDVTSLPAEQPVAVEKTGL